MKKVEDIIEDGDEECPLWHILWSNGTIEYTSDPERVKYLEEHHFAL